MGLSITTDNLKVIDTSLEKFKDTLGKKSVKEVARLLVEVLTADSRLVKIAQKDIGKYTEGRQPAGDFDFIGFETKTPQGDDITYKVKCENGGYWVELHSDKNLIKGWHPDLIERLKVANISVTKDLVNVLFAAGQAVILSHIKKPRATTAPAGGKKPYQGKPKARA